MTEQTTERGSEPSVELKGLTKRFGDDVTAVDSIDLEIDDGEFFALLGPSGCGKTTTLRMIAGLEFPTEGSLKIYGEEMGTLSPNKRPVNTVFPELRTLPPHDHSRERFLWPQDAEDRENGSVQAST